ncbi:hypothetical protein PBT90_19485 [Algoriphagus halophytocola]|uniref:Uncharacterized protein n=1 Tax=Algoriphagus halophytocola TaxID=2991499 RepID=A0ABY6MHP3_9BACT|nr:MULTISPECIES: hypothetical protein [unclassified Algoriphagus]UZD21699.1 hypothetical protein OM944_13620 [Algoriphagus sp. TR-M5]WBL42911.1 hypothetical protein PBT90_19485 [Algoriphagus sp. TR-M9]
MSKKQFGNIGKFSSKNLKIKPIDIKVNPSNRISNAQLKKLDPKGIASIPALRVNRNDLLNLQANESWEITAQKLKDKDMYVAEYFGWYRSDQTSIDVHPENKYYPRLNNGMAGFLPEMRYLVLRFRPEMGKRYRVTIQLKPGSYRNKKVMTNITGSYNDTWYINYQFNELMFDFLASSNEIKISPIIAGYENYYVKYQPLQIEKINVDKVGD